MSQIRIQAFLSESSTPNDINLTQMLESLQTEFEEKLQITFLKSNDDLISKYNLTSTPALVIGEMIKIMGFCPSKESIVSALKELGV